MRYNVTLISVNPEDEERLAYIARVSTGFDYSEINNPAALKYSFVANKKTALTLCKLRHESVFEFVDFCYWIECPIFVARQLMRYRCASYIEKSGRRTAPLEIPETENETTEDSAARVRYNNSLKYYNTLVNAGMSKENARRVLTLEEPTQYLFKCNLRELLHIFNERLQKDAQPETRRVVSLMYNLVADSFPVVMGYYKKAYNWSVEE